MEEKITKTIQTRLRVDAEQKEALDNLMRKFSSAVRIAYNRLKEGYDRKDLKRNLAISCEINTRYADDAILKAQRILNRSGKDTKVIFGGKHFFNKLKKKHLDNKKQNELKKKWKDKRQGNLYARGDSTKQGNPNLRILYENGKWYIRITIANRTYIKCPISANHNSWNEFMGVLLTGEAYTVELKRRDGAYYAYISYKISIPDLRIRKSNGVIGVDVNAIPSHLAYVVSNSNGNWIVYGEIQTPKLHAGKRNKRDYFAWIRE